MKDMFIHSPLKWHLLTNLPFSNGQPEMSDGVKSLFVKEEHQSISILKARKGSSTANAQKQTSLRPQWAQLWAA